MLTDLKLIGYVGQLSIGRSSRPGGALRSLFVKLPTAVQFELWQACAASLSNIVLRLEVSMLNIHHKVGAVAARTPNLRSLVLSRYNNEDHTASECAKQLSAIRSVVAFSVTVSCSICRANE